MNILGKEITTTRKTSTQVGTEPIPPEVYEEYEEEEEQAQEVYGVEPVPVHITGSDTRRESPEFAGWTTVTIQPAPVTQSPYCTQILNRAINRYKAKMVLNPQTGCTGVWFNGRPDSLGSANPQGYFYNTTTITENMSLPDYDGQPPLYAVAIGGPCLISVLDERFGNPQA
jgi:hypothetical protein